MPCVVFIFNLYGGLLIRQGSWVLACFYWGYEGDVGLCIVNCWFEGEI